MFHVEKISSFDRPELAPYRTMRRSAEHEAQGIFIAEGEKVTRRLLESRFTVVSIVLPEKHLENYRSLLEARPEPVSVYLAEKELLEELTGFSLFQGALVRNCVAFGVQGLIVGETSSSPFLRRSVRNSMGTIFQLPVWEVKMANQAVASRRDDPARFSLAQTLR